MIVLPHRPANPQVSLFVFAFLLLARSRGEALVRRRRGAVFRSDLQEETQAARPNMGPVEEIRIQTESLPKPVGFMTVEAIGE